MATCRNNMWRILALVLSWLPFLCCASESIPTPLLINNVQLWDSAADASGRTSILIVNRRIQRIGRPTPDLPEDTIVIDANGRAIMGRLELGEVANLLVVEGNPAEDITVLANPAAHYLVIRNGVVLESRVQAPESPGELEPSQKYKALDPQRFRVFSLPEQPWYTYSAENFSLAFGGGVLMDRTEFDQDSDGRDQIGDLKVFNSGEVRAVRMGIGGRIGLFGQRWKYALIGANRAFDQGFNTDRKEEWIWYDWAIGIPVFGGAELKIGKQKENLSHDRLTLLVDQPFMERAAVLDAMLPSRNTGVTLSNSALDGRVSWSVGGFTDMLGDRDSEFEDSNQLGVRLTGVAFENESAHQLLHLGIGYRYSDVDSGILRFRSGPEAYFSPNFVDTGEFAASGSRLLSLEGGWRQGPLWLSAEYVHTEVDAAALGDPVFDGFHLTGAWSVTGEHRDYYRGKGVFTKLKPARDVSTGGPGAWEAVARYSRVDLEDKGVAGGDMSRLSLGLNWYPTSVFKSTLQYGLVDLDRFGTSSTTHVLQFRMNFLLGM